ncbi:MAG: holo-ACP synthase [Elusimicrobia bacterium]|jgi:phosphopantetheine--protein transferase-like protein|nr:holo-ACP synthase [Elusimicrobiota bacterium]
MKVGIDIVEVKRIKKLSGMSSFIERVFSEKEQSYCKRFKNTYERYAGKFAAKEAVIKAFKSLPAGELKSFFLKLPLKKINILNKSDGMPFLKIEGIKVDASLSITHTSDYAAAICIIENAELVK